MLHAEEKRRFMFYELGLLSLKAALSTRNAEYPIYANDAKLQQRNLAQIVFRNALAEIEKKYMAGDVSEIQHIKYIESLSARISAQIGDALHKSRFRVGVAQKLVNVHLKYLWAAGYIHEPPHCPIDGIIRDKAKIDYDWIASDCIEEYTKAISDLKKVAGIKSLSLWELESFRRRAEA